MTADTPVNINMDIKANANLDPAIKAIPKGLSKLFFLLFGRREADNLRYKMLTATQTKRECQQILSGKYNFVNNQVVLVENSLSTEYLNPMQVEIEQETEKLAGNVKMTIDALKDIPDEQISDSEVDEDFFARWRREAKVIGNEELQRLWGRLLAEEIKEPESVPFRVLDILKNISSAEANLFQRLTPYICNSEFIVASFGTGTFPGDFTLDDYLHLFECGLTHHPDSRYTFFPEEKILISGKVYTRIDFKSFIVAVDLDGEVTIPGVLLSTAGKIVCKICAHSKPNETSLQYMLGSIVHETHSHLKDIKCYHRVDNSIYDHEEPFCGYI